LKNLLLKIKQPWSLLRLIRLALATILLMEAWHSQSWWLLIPGFFFLYQSINNAGCSTCPTPNYTGKAHSEDIEYEEVKE